MLFRDVAGRRGRPHRGCSPGAREYWGNPGGTFGDLTVLSFGRGKGWTGEGGGALLVRHRDPRLADEVERTDLPSTFGGVVKPMVLATAQWGLGRPSLYGLPSALPGLGLGQSLYRDPQPIQSIPSFSAALAASTAQAASEEIEARTRKASVLEGH